ncbi:very short patch repair endonuclease [uncultured Duncaniella sp.]|nr:very short patch repair endonuclease [uncultured Duncaniella sp.]
MADVKTPEQRSRNMAAIKGKDTKPEIIVRKYLFSRGLRFRVQVKKLPGNPDIVLPKYKTVIFVNGCLWHGHEGCKYFRLPKSNVEFWKEKIERNIERDRESMQALLDLRWKVIRVWECELRNKANREVTLNKI